MARKNDSIINKYLLETFEFRHNVISNMIEFKFIANSIVNIFSRDWTDMTDRYFNTIYDDLISNPDRDISFDDLKKKISRIDISVSYDPVTEYINNLPVWDGHDYLSDLKDTIETDQAELWQFDLKKWMISFTTSLMNHTISDTKSYNEMMLVFIGAEGLGKSRWARSIIPKSLYKYTRTGRLQIGNKDSNFILAQNIMIFCDELDQYTRSRDMKKLQDYLSIPFIRERMVYGTYMQNFPRLANFIGSTTEESFIEELEGTRRFLCHKILSINYEHNINIDQLYAQLKKMVENGERGWYNSEERKVLNRNNDKFKTSCIEFDLIEKTFCHPFVEKDEYWVSATDVLLDLSSNNNVPVSSLNVTKVGIALKKLGFVKKVKYFNNTQGFRWFICTKSNYEIDKFSFSEYNSNIIEQPVF